MSIGQKKASVDWSKEMLQKYDRGASKHGYDIVTGNESWNYAYEPKSKQQSTVWVFQDEPNPTIVYRTLRTSKRMITCFFLEKLDMPQSYDSNNAEQSILSGTLTHWFKQLHF